MFRSDDGRTLAPFPSTSGSNSALASLKKKALLVQDAPYAMLMLRVTGTLNVNRVVAVVAACMGLIVRKKMIPSTPHRPNWFILSPLVW